MNKLLLLISIILLGTFLSLGQEKTFEITQQGNVYSSEQIDLAFLNADLCGFYISAVRRKIYFDDGTIVELKKQSELPQVSGACFINYNPKLENDVWRITSTNHLVRIIPITPAK